MVPRVLVPVSRRRRRETRTKTPHDPFVPSRHGLHFDNAFPKGPVITVDLGVTTVPIGNAANGLCGGMVFASLDYWMAGRALPADIDPPACGTPLFGYLVRRLIDSWDLPSGPATYLLLMQPWYPDGDRQIGPFTVHGRAWRMAVREWPSVQADLDAGQPCPLGLVKISSPNPADLGRNHQVLAYRYDCVGTAVTLHVYDPNQADNDRVTLSFDIGDPTAPGPIALAPDVSATTGVSCFFRVPYRPKPPPASA